ncbi:MAG TPA: NHL repeat-containing protein, partial [Gemmatimonadaceae bacterium]
MKLKFASTVAALLFLNISVVQADSFFVTNPGINTITKYDDNGTGTLFTKSYLNGPTGIALDASGNVYVSTKSNTIEKFAPDGSSLGVFASSGLNNPSGLVFDRGGNLYVANFNGNTVEKFGPDGGILGTFANVIQPPGIAFDSAGNLCVASFANLVQRFAADGTPLVPFTSAALSQPQGLAFDSVGALYVASSASNIVEKFSPNGVDLGIAPQIFGVPTAVKDGAQAVHIAYRTDGVAGDGSLHNPFDGSTQSKLDAIFKSYYDAGATDITFHIGPGTFQMKGAWDYDWAMLTGWHVKGSGRSLTIIQQVVGTAGVNPGSNGALFSNGPALTYDNQSVEDLTCDCAWFRSGPGGDNSRPHGNFQGINLYGANPTIRNVSVTGCGWQDNECFAILTSGGVNDRNLPDNALYENVEVSNGATGVYATHLTGMAMINLAAMGSDPTPVYAKNGRITNCTFNLPTAGNAGGPPAGYDGGVVTGCTFIGDWHGIYFDTFVSKNITIVGNTIKALYPDSVGVLFNPGTTSTPLENITIVGNTVYAAAGFGFASGVKDSSILGNRIHLGPTNNPDGSVVFLTSTVQNILVSQNSIDAGIPFFSEETSGCTFSANRTPAGATAIPDSEQAGEAAAPLDYGMLTAFNGAGLSAPFGVAFDSSDNLHVVNSNHSTV